MEVEGRGRRRRSERGIGRRGAALRLARMRARRGSPARSAAGARSGNRRATATPCPAPRARTRRPRWCVSSTRTTCARRRRAALRAPARVARLSVLGPLDARRVVHARARCTSCWCRAPCRPDTCRAFADELALGRGERVDAELVGTGASGTAARRRSPRLAASCVLASSARLCASVIHWNTSSNSRGFHRQRHREVLRRMELVPVARRGEFPQRATQRVELRRAVVCRVHASELLVAAQVAPFARPAAARATRCRCARASVPSPRVPRARTCGGSGACVLRAARSAAGPRSATTRARASASRRRARGRAAAASCLPHRACLRRAPDIPSRPRSRCRSGASRRGRPA